MAAQSTPKLVLGVGMGSMITLSAMSPNAANLYNIGSVDPHIVAAVVGAFGGLIALLALLTLIRRWHKR
jgi:multisubunit Na+/H+ antiporter MnhB subunit